MQGEIVKTETIEQPRPISEVARELRETLGHTQQSWAVALGWSVSTAVRFEHGAQPSPRMLAQMVGAAHAGGLDDLAAEIQLYLNVALGPNFPVNPDDEMEHYFVLIARRIYQDKRRHAAFLKFAAHEIETLKRENLIRKEHQERLFAGMDALAEKLKGGRK
jgi:hypothetical protein